MTHKERFYATIERRPVDRPASWLGLPEESAIPKLLTFFGEDSLDGIRRRLNDDIYPVEVPYSSPAGNAIHMALDFAKAGTVHSNEERTLTSPGFFEDYSDPAGIDDFDWPDPALYIDRDAARSDIAKIEGDYAVMAMLWSAHFQDACAAFGMETALIKMMTEPEMFRVVIDRVLDFYLKANEIYLEAAADGLDAVLIGNDFGSQTSLMLSPQLLREFVFPGTRALVEQAHSYGLKVIHHSCGAIYDIIPDLIDLGVDAIHPIQAKAANLEPERLQENFAGRVSFCGGVDAQYMLVNGEPFEVEQTVRKLMDLFPTGLILSPSHEAILEDTKPANLVALFDTVSDAAGKLVES